MWKEGGREDGEGAVASWRDFLLLPLSCHMHMQIQTHTDSHLRTHTQEYTNNDKAPHNHSIIYESRCIIQKAA